MYILLALLIGVIIGLFRRGSISGMFSKPYNKWFIGLIGIIGEILLHFYCYIPPIPALGQYLPIINFISYLLILIMLIFNLDDVFTIILAIGITLNFIVTFINGGFLPVSEEVISIMPLYSRMTQSIYTGTNGVYQLMQPPQTLLSFLGVNIALPYFVSTVVLTGTVCGLSIGDIFLLIGLAGVIQQAMVKGKIYKQEESSNIEMGDQYPVYPETSQPYFESKTEELFFEDGILPANPLDKIFKDEEPVSQTKILSQIAPLKQSEDTVENWSESDEAERTKVFSELESLTIPIGTGNKPQQPTSSVNKQPQDTQTNPAVLEDEIDGFFLSQYFADREKHQAEKDFFDTLTTEELFKEETEIVSEPFSASAAPKEEHRILRKESEIQAELTANEPEIKEEESSPKIQVDLQALLDELEQDSYQGRRRRAPEEKEESGIETIEEQVISQTVNSSENSEVVDKTENEQTKPVPEKETQPQLEEDTKPYPETTKLAEEISKPGLFSYRAQEQKKEPLKEMMRAVEEIKARQPAESIEGKVEPEEGRHPESERLEHRQVQQMDLGENLNNSETYENLTRIVSDENEVEDTKAQVQTDQASKMPGRSSRYVTLTGDDKKTGYIVTKSYIKEQAQMDKSEQEMLDVWQQISMENNERKNERRRRASANYQTDNPYVEEQERMRNAKMAQEEAQRKAQEAYERKQAQELSMHQNVTAEAVNAQFEDEKSMTDEERIAAGYKLVSFEVSGKTISFWKK